MKSREGAADQRDLIVSWDDERDQAWIWHGLLRGLSATADCPQCLRPEVTAPQVEVARADQGHFSHMFWLCDKADAATRGHDVQGILVKWLSQSALQSGR